jgi:hypothetical protein
MSEEKETDLDRPLWGAEAIGREAGLFKKEKETGQTVIDPKTGEPEVDIRRAFYLLESGLLPATKVGNQWSSTPRLVRGVWTEGAAEQTAARRKAKIAAGEAALAAQHRSRKLLRKRA